jgi:hypothetical protein
LVSLAKWLRARLRVVISGNFDQLLMGDNVDQYDKEDAFRPAQLMF